MIKHHDFNVIHALILDDLDSPDFKGECRLGSSNENFGVSFCLEDINNNLCYYTNEEYAKDFYDWMIKGENNMDDLIATYPHVSKFEHDGQVAFSTYYGPRILAQLDDAMETALKFRRRATIHILEPRDKSLLKLSTTQEYPCAKDIQLLVRNGRLHMYVTMRSNNAEKVLPYDVYNFTRLQQHLCQMYGLAHGNYYHTAISMHKFIK